MPVSTSPNSGQVRVAGTGAIWRAPAGTVTPTDSTSAWNAAFQNLGFVSDGGFTSTPNYKANQVRGWQSRGVLRNITTEYDFKFGFELLQMNIATLALAWGGATITAGVAGAYTLAINDDPSTEFVLGIDWSDGAFNQRIIVSRASLMTLPVIKSVRTDAIRYAFEVQTLTPVDGTAQVKVFGVDASVAGP
jgi:hypothetical protein